MARKHRQRRKRQKLAAARRRAPSVVVDTNVFLETHSCHDVFNAINEKAGAVEDPDVTFRIQKARESMLLAIYFHETRTVTWGLHSEAVDMLMRRAPPTTPGQSMESDYVMAWVWFTKDRVLGKWTSAMPKKPGAERGNAADAALVAYAREHGLPFVTNEGVTKEGIFDDSKRGSARRRAIDAGVPVFAPRQFYAGKMDEQAAIERFLRRFKRRGLRYVERKNETWGPLLQWIYGYYRLILRGEVEGRATPIRLALW